MEYHTILTEQGTTEIQYVCKLMHFIQNTCQEKVSILASRKLIR